MPYRIKRSLLFDVLEASGNLFPNEFFALLSGDRKNKLLSEFVVAPAEYSRNSAMVKTHLLPLDRSIFGSIHSHPRGSPSPSLMDLQNFAKFGEIHLITFPPFDAGSFRCFDARGRKVEIIAVD